MRCQFFFGISIIAVKNNGKSLFSAHKLDHLICSGIFLFFCQVINQRFSVNIRTKTVQSKSLINIKSIIPALIQNNMEAGTDGIPVGLKDFQDFIGNPVQCKILFSGRIISSIILKGNRISQHICCQLLTISVIDIATRTFDHTFFCCS